MTFDPKAHLLKLPRRTNDKATGQYVTVYDDFLEVKRRVVAFRERYPHGTIVTEEIVVDLDRGYARYKAMVTDGEGGLASSYGTETKAGFEDYAERAATRAVGRALALLEFGTEFAAEELDELPHVADGPLALAMNGHITRPDGPTDETVSVARVVPHEASTSPEPAETSVPAAQAPVPEAIPEGLKLPCGGALIVDLSPGQLHMLISKCAFRLTSDPSIAPLHTALTQERQRRLDAGDRNGSAAT